MRQMKNAYKIVFGKPQGKRPLESRRRAWEDNIRMDLKEIRREDVDRIELAQNRSQWRALANMVMNRRVQ
jgi:hypothetical protein